MKNRIFVLCVMIFLILKAHGQNNNKTEIVFDTVTIYDTIIIYDTVFIYDTIRIFENQGTSKDAFLPELLNAKNAVLQIDTATLNACLILFSNKNAATLPIKYILIHDNMNSNQKSLSMKRIGFFGLMLLAFQSTVMSQTDFGISAGGGTWWANCNKSAIKSEFSPAFNAGLFLNHSIRSSNFAVKLELNYHYLMSNYSYKAVIDTVNWVVVGEAESAINYHQFSIPLSIGYKIHKLQPFIGMMYSFRMSEAWLDKQINSFGLDVGISYLLSANISLSLSYYHGFTKDYKYKIGILNPATNISEDKNFYWKSNCISFSVNYTFKNSQKE